MSETPDPTTNTPATFHVVRLRAALQAARAESDVPVSENDAPAHDAARKRRRQLARAIDEAAAPLITQFMPPLSRACAGYVRQAPPHSRIEGDDLMQDAWTAALDYLRDGETGSRIQNDVHFERLLKKCAFHLFLNHRRRKEAQIRLDAPFEDGETLGQRLPDPLPLPQELLLAPQSAWSDWLNVLFTGTPNAFRAACRTPPRRRSVVYQAFVLIAFAGFLRVLQSETGARGQFGQSILRELSLRLRVPPPFWEIAERATRAAPPMEDGYGKTRDAGVCEEIKQSVCNEIGVPPMSQSLFYVLRNEARKLAMGDG